MLLVSVSEKKVRWNLGQVHFGVENVIKLERREQLLLFVSKARVLLNASPLFMATGDQHFLVKNRARTHAEEARVRHRVFWGVFSFQLPFNHK